MCISDVKNFFLCFYSCYIFFYLCLSFGVSVAHQGFWYHEREKPRHGCWWEKTLRHETPTSIKSGYQKNLICKFLRNMPIVSCLLFPFSSKILFLAPEQSELLQHCHLSCHNSSYLTKQWLFLVILKYFIFQIDGILLTFY